MPDNHTRNRLLLAVLIDAQNIPAQHAANIMREIATIGEPALRRVYEDWTNPPIKGYQDPIHELSLVAHQKTSNTKSKNAADFGLVIDAMDFLHSGNFDGFVLLSSDSGFTSLANRLREDGKLVISIGEEKTTAALRNAVNRFIMIENLELTETTQSSPAQNPNAAFDLIKQAMAKMDPNDDWYGLGELGNVIRAAHSDFDTRTYNCARLSQLVQSIPKLEYNAQNHREVRL